MFWSAPIVQLIRQHTKDSCEYSCNVLQKPRNIEFQKNVVFAEIVCHIINTLLLPKFSYKKMKIVCKYWQYILMELYWKNSYWKFVWLILVLRRKEITEKPVSLTGQTNFSSKGNPSYFSENSLLMENKTGFFCIWLGV